MKRLTFLIILNTTFNFAFNQIQSTEIIEKEFYEFMDKDSKNFAKKYSTAKNIRTLNMLKRLYVKNRNKKNIILKAKIPKKIHQIWVGNKQKPKFLESFQKTWLEKHPSWEYKLWTNEDVEKLTLINRKLYDKTNNPREKANILRYELLYQFGGLYVDCDFLCLKPFDELNNCYDFYAGISANNLPEIINNALIASTPKHPLIEHIVKNIKDIDLPDNRHRSGVYYFSKEIVNKIANLPGSNIAFPTNVFYAVPFKNKINSEKELFKFAKPESMALHYWANSSKIDQLFIK